MAKFPEKYRNERLDALREQVLKHMDMGQIGGYGELFRSLSDKYGVLPLSKLYEMLTGHYGYELSQDAFIALCEYFRHEQGNWYSIAAEDELYGDDVTESETPPMERMLIIDFYTDYDEYAPLDDYLEGKPWYVYPLSDVKEYESSKRLCCFDDTRYYHRAKRWLEINVSPDRAEDILDDIMIGLNMVDGSIYHALSDIQRLGRTLSFDEAKQFVPYYIDLNNHFRKSLNRCCTPCEAEKLREEYGFETETGFLNHIELDEEKVMSIMSSGRGMNDAVAMLRQLLLNGAPVTAGKKVGRNDPCPCGSGKKYKKCCGR